MAALEQARKEAEWELALLHEELAARKAEEQLQALLQQHAPALWTAASPGVRQDARPWRCWLFRRKR